MCNSSTITHILCFTLTNFTEKLRSVAIAVNLLFRFAHTNPIKSKRFLLMGNAHGHRKHFNHGVNTSPPTNNAPSPFNKYSSSEPTSRNSTSTSKMASLPYAHVDSSLRALAAQAEGFGRSAIGGLHGSVYCVTNLAGAICFPLFMNKFNLVVSEVVGMQELRC